MLFTVSFPLVLQILLLVLCRVVTSLKYQLYEIPEFVIGGDLYYPMSKAASAFKIIRDFVREKEDNRLAVYMMLHFKRSG